MTNVNMKNAMAEVLEYLKGIRKEDLDKISPKFMRFLEENASKDYIPDFDYTKPLSELNLMNSSKAIICFICYKYWCETEEEKIEFYNLLKENDKKYELEWKEKSANLFKSKENKNVSMENNMLIKTNEKKGLFSKIKELLNKLFGLKRKEKK